MKTEAPTLGAQARSGLLWTGGFRLFQGLLQFALTVVLVRLLSPEDYGAYAVVAGLVGFLNAESFEAFLGYTIRPSRMAKCFR